MSNLTETWEGVLTILSRWNAPNDQSLPNGTRLIRHVPHVGSLAYLHVVYGPLVENQIDDVEGQIGRKLPAALRRFYMLANGCSLFSGALNFYGLRFDYDRSLSYLSRQPISMEYPNVLERPRNADQRDVFFASYKWDGTQVLVKEDGSVTACSRFNAQTTLFQWPSIEQMMISEVTRIAHLFDRNGQKIEEGKPTVPFHSH